jgi:hypothetical protein
MMSWFAPKCPVAGKEKDWIEAMVQWILNEFDHKPLADVAVILPTPEFFPDRYSEDGDDVRTLVDRVCSYMNEDPARIELDLCYDEGRELRHRLPSFESSGRGAAGSFQKGEGKCVIKISAAYLRDPMSLVAIVAHELGHVLLLGDERITRETKGHEHLTDLLTVFLGLGIFNANSAFRFTQWGGGGKQGWEAKRLGYMSENMFGYALALFAWLRGETKPHWSKYLEGNVKYYFKSALNYLEKTGDSSVTRLALPRTR